MHVKQSEWICRTCNERNFSYRDVCRQNSCGAPRVALPTSHHSSSPTCTSNPYNMPNPYNTGLRKSDSDRSSRNRNSGGNVPPKLRPGDWICHQCSFHNFAQRIQCKQCFAMKSVVPDNTNLHPPSKNMFKDGDWYCPRCNYMNFSRRHKCHECDTLRISTEKILSLKTTYSQNGNTNSLTSVAVAPQNGNTAKPLSPQSVYTNTVRPVSPLQNQRQDDAEKTNRGPIVSMRKFVNQGDWVCKGCEYVNFRKRTHCYDCKEPHTEDDLKVPSAPNSGDWACSTCGHSNFRRNSQCLKCSTSKTSPQSLTVEVEFYEAWRCVNCQIYVKRHSIVCPHCKGNRDSCEQKRDKHGHLIKNKDWRCPGCNENNFAMRTICFNCKEPQPHSELDCNRREIGDLIHVGSSRTKKVPEIFPDDELRLLAPETGNMQIYA